VFAPDVHAARALTAETPDRITDGPLVDPAAGRALTI
jgi:hypothetical protein